MSEMKTAVIRRRDQEPCSACHRIMSVAETTQARKRVGEDGKLYHPGPDNCFPGWAGKIPPKPPTLEAVRFVSMPREPEANIKVLSMRPPKPRPFNGVRTRA